jgi:hypothetical protein
MDPESNKSWAGRIDENSWCAEHECPYSLCEGLHPTARDEGIEPPGNYTSIITREGNGSDVDGKPDPLVKEPKE